MQPVYAKAQRIRLAIFDVDGVLTDGSLYLTDGGEEIKAFNALDGHGLKMLRESGVELAIITGRTSRVSGMSMASSVRSPRPRADATSTTTRRKARSKRRIVRPCT